jgi:hypothetical protein
MARLLRRADICPTGKSFLVFRSGDLVMSTAQAKNITLPFFGKL